MEKEELLYQLALIQVPKVGPVIAKNLISYCGSARAVFTSTKKGLLAVPGVGPQIVQALSDKNVLLHAEKELQNIETRDIRAICYQEAAYPRRLKQLDTSPLILFVKGNPDLNHPRIVAIVGTRSPTDYGIAHCREIVQALTPYQPLIISGLAYGIDYCAHKAALEHQLPTVGVLAHGLGFIYPNSHRAIARQMQLDGGLVSEYPTFKAVEKEFFPMRNRIVAGLTDALIVIETRKKGGSIITTNFANTFNRDVFAIPGRTSDEASAGCNHLIKTHKAALLETVEDLAYVMNWEPVSDEQGFQQQLFPDLTEEEKNIVALLKATEGLGIDQLSYTLQLSNSRLAASLLSLEVKGVIKPLPGKRFRLHSNQL